jgi:hypothetical protein
VSDKSGTASSAPAPSSRLGRCRRSSSGPAKSGVTPFLLRWVPNVGRKASRRAWHGIIGQRPIADWRNHWLAASQAGRRGSDPLVRSTSCPCQQTCPPKSAAQRTKEDATACHQAPIVAPADVPGHNGELPVRSANSQEAAVWATGQRGPTFHFRLGIGFSATAQSNVSRIARAPYAFSRQSSPLFGSPQGGRGGGHLPAGCVIRVPGCRP